MPQQPVTGDVYFDLSDNTIKVSGEEGVHVFGQANDNVFIFDIEIYGLTIPDPLSQSSILNPSLASTLLEYARNGKSIVLKVPHTNPVFSYCYLHLVAVADGGNNLFRMYFGGDFAYTVNNLSVVISGNEVFLSRD